MARDEVSCIICDINLDIWDISGIKILSLESFHQRYTWITGNMPEGIYIYSLVTEDGKVISGKIMKQ